MLSESEDHIHDTVKNTGFSISGDTLEVYPPFWSMKQNFAVRGVSGVSHRLEYYFQSANGESIAVISTEPSEDSIYEIVGRVQILRLEVSPNIFIMCGCANYPEHLQKALKLSGINMIRRIQFDHMVFEGHAGRSAPLSGTNPGARHKNLRTKRDRMKIMLDVLELLSTQSSRITNIIYKCNLNYRTANELLDELIMKKYVEIKKANEKENSYCLTKTGSEVLQNVRKLYSQ